MRLATLCISVIALACGNPNDGSPSNDLPSGTIAYTRDIYRNGIETRLFLLHLPSQHSDSLLASPLTIHYGIQPSPGSGVLLLARAHGARAGDDSTFLFSLTTRQLTFLGQFDGRAMWDPSGTRLVYAVPTGSGNQVVVAPVGGSDVDTLGFGEDPTWSPDGGTVLFTYRPANLDLEVGIMSLASPASQMNLSNSIGDDRFPRWAPDGQSIVFGSTRVNAPGVYLMNSDGSNQHRISPILLNLPPIWSPNGSLIAALGSDAPGTSGTLHLLRPNGQLLSTLPFSPGSVTSFSWSADGKYLVVAARRTEADTDNHLYLVSVSGGAPFPVLPDSVVIGEARWL